MKSLLIVTIIISITFSKVFGQTQYTLYDEIPGIDKTYKPSYSSDYVGWKKMLYQYPVNFEVLEKDFNAYIQQHPKEKSAIIRYYKIWSRVISQFTNASGEIILPDIDDIRKKQFLSQKAMAESKKSASINQSNWTFLGPKETFWRNEEGINYEHLDENGDPKQCPWQANVYSFDVATSNNNILYCGTETGFINKSADKGLTWLQVGINYPFGGGVPAIAINPNSPDTVYVSAGKQMHKTGDGGVTWTPLLSGSIEFGASRLKINPTNTNQIIAGATEGLYKSDDAGASWKRKWSRPVWDVEFNAGNPDEIYAISKNSNDIFQVIISTDGGETFIVDSNFPTDYNETSGGLLAVTPANPDILYATLLAKENEEGVPFILKGIKTDGDFTWTETKKGIVGGNLSEFSNGQGYFDLVLEVSPNEENLVFWGTCSLWKSTDGGVTFEGVGGYNGNFPIHPDIQDIKILPNGETWVATDGGMNYSGDLFSSIGNYSSRTKGIVGSDMWGFDQGWNEDIIVGGRYHNGNTALSDLYGDKALRMGGAESPTGWVIKGKSRHVAFNDLGNGWILPKTANEPAEGRFIFSKFPNMDEYGGRRSNLVQHPNYYGTIYVGEGDALWKSTDSGKSFDLLFQYAGRIRHFQISHKNPDVLYADIVGQGLYRSSDGGISWIQKPALTNGLNGNSNWNGKLFFVISPNDENKIYACLQNGTWSNDLGQVYKSEDGGNTWINWTNGIEEYTKCMVIQPAQNQEDLVYLFTQSTNGTNSNVFVRHEKQPYWNEFASNYPAGKSVNLALPFYRDSKIRVAGNAGVWESPMAETKFVPLVNPWVEKQIYNCMEDTLYFNDHSVLNHSGASWKWRISPEPEFISNTEIRNPKVVLGTPGTYDVSLTVTQNGMSYEKTIEAMVTTSTCPSVHDCNNPAEIDKNNWTLLYTDSEETTGEDGKATNAFDGDPATIWHTEWYYQNTPHPHEIQIDLGQQYNISKVTYLPRQNSANGRIKDYEIYISNNKTQWGTLVKQGSFPEGAGRKTVEFPAVTGQYICFKSLTEQNNNAFSSIAELDVTGCLNITSVSESKTLNIEAYPIPAKNRITVSLPGLQTMKNLNYTFYTTSSVVVKSGNITATNNTHSFDISNLKTGTYILKITNKNGQIFRIKLIKN